MNGVLVTGVPGVGKGDVCDKARDILETADLGKVLRVSLGDIVARDARATMHTQKQRIPYIEPSRLDIMRMNAASEAAGRILSTSPDYTIIDSPAAIYTHEGVIPNAAMTRKHIDSISGALNSNLLTIVTVIDDATEISERLSDTPYPNTPDEVLRWVAYDAEISRAIAPNTARNIVVAKSEAPLAIAKMVFDPESDFGYLAFPISRLKHKPELDAEANQIRRLHRESIQYFRNELLHYANVAVPMVMADGRAESAVEIEATEHRDLHYFVGGGDFTLAFLPDDGKVSSGVTSELRRTKEQGGYVILISPEHKKKAFGVNPDLHFPHQEAFWETLENIHRKGYDSEPKKFLRRFKKGRSPRFAKLAEAYEQMVS